jgi:hypothetical protein
MAKAFIVVLPDEIDIFGDGDMGRAEDWLFGTLQNNLEHFQVQPAPTDYALVRELINDLDEEITESEGGLSHD